MEEVKTEIERVVRLLFGIEVEVEMTMTEGQYFENGREVDYATNVAMKLAGELSRAPREIAEEIVEGFSLEGYRKEVAGPGFINIIASHEYFMRELGQMTRNFQEYISRDEYFGKIIVCEFSDPNPFKVLHIGHLYTSIVGDGISRLLEYAGARVIRANFGGDVGLHVAKTLYAERLLSEWNSSSADALLTRRMSNTPRSATPASLNSISDSTPSQIAEVLAECYVEGTRAYEEDEEAKAEIVKLNKEIYHIAESGERESELAQAYWAGREASYAYFKEFYKKLGIEFDRYYPESTVAELGLKTVKRQEAKGVYTESDGAVVFRGEEYGLHTRVFINKEGLPTYETKDVGLLLTKWGDYKFDQSIVITGNEITDYMKVVLKSVSLYAPEPVERTLHLTHGMVKLPGKVKMSSRLGNFVRAMDIIETVMEKLGGGDEKLTMAAIKYAFLKYKMGGDIEFDAESSVATNGNSGIYLEYAVVRGKKILGKLREAEAERTEELAPMPRKFDQVERPLMKKMSQYRYVLDEAIGELAPHKICAYLYELAQEFSRFYEKAQVVGHEREELRGKLVKGYVAILEHGLNLIGIETVEEM